MVAKDVAKVRKVSVPVKPLTAAAFAAGREGTVPQPVSRPSSVDKLDSK